MELVKRKKKYPISIGFALVDFFPKKKGFKVSISAKFSKKAVERNKMKRQVREIIREKMKNEERKIEIIACINRKVDEKIKFSDLEREFDALIKKIK